MSTDSYSTACLWTGRLLSALITLALLADGANILLSQSSTNAQLAATGFPDSAGRR